MTSALSLLAVLAITVFLAGAAFGGLLVFVISIHRTGRAPLSESHGDRAGSFPRRLLTGIRSDHTEAGK
jgi:hypothetical protein